MKKRCRLKTAGEREEMAKGDPGFARIAFPFSDGVGDELVKTEVPFADGDERGDSPEVFCPAKDRPACVGPAAIGVVLEDGLAVLHHQEGSSMTGFRVGGRAGAGGWCDCGEGGGGKEYGGDQ